MEGGLLTQPEHVGLLWKTSEGGWGLGQGYHGNWVSAGHRCATGSKPKSFWLSVICPSLSTLSVLVIHLLRLPVKIFSVPLPSSVMSQQGSPSATIQVPRKGLFSLTPPALGTGWSQAPTLTVLFLSLLGTQRPRSLMGLSPP